MTQRKKKQDKLIAGFLALLTAFSPVAPVYAAGSNDVSSSVTMDPDSITVEEGSDGIVLENPDSTDSNEGTDGITVMDDGESSDGITIDNITKSEDGIIIESTDENGNSSITLDPWGEDSTENAVAVPKMYELSIDLRSVHGVVKMMPVDADESDLDQIKYIRVSESDDGYNITVTDGNDAVVYESPYDELYGFAWSEFMDRDKSYTVEAIADDGYVVTDYSIVSPRNLDEITDVNDFKPGVYSSYSWVMGNLKHDRAVIVNFGSGDGSDITVDDFGLPGTSDLMNVEVSGNLDKNVADDESDSEEVTETVVLESEKDTLGYEGVEVISSQVDDVEIPEITKSDRKEAICDPVYEGYIRDNINSDYVDFQDLNPAGNMIVKQTFFDRSRLNGRTTIDEIMFSDDEDKTFTLVAQMDTMIPVYDVGDPKYYVSYVDTMHNDSRSEVIDHEFAFNNLGGEVLDDCIYDYETGIAYINKDYFFDDDGKFTLNRVQVQLGQAVDYNPQYTESVVLDGMSDDINVDAFDVFLGECTFYVDKGLDFGSGDGFAT